MPSRPWIPLGALLVGLPVALVVTFEGARGGRGDRLPVLVAEPDRGAPNTPAADRLSAGRDPVRGVQPFRVAEPPVALASPARRPPSHADRARAAMIQQVLMRRNPVAGLAADPALFEPLDDRHPLIQLGMAGAARPQPTDCSELTPAARAARDRTYVELGIGDRTRRFDWTH